MNSVNNWGCINNLCRKSMAANRRRNIILTIAIVLTTVMMTTLFTSGGSIMRSVERNTMYQVGTSKQAGFKFLTQEEYDQLSGDPEVHDLSYNIIVGEILNEELNEDYTEVRYTTEDAAECGFSLPETGSLPEEPDEIATCTSVLDAFGVSHEIGEIIHLKISNGFDEYEGDFRLSGYWKKPAATMANEIYVSKEFQEGFSPAWRNKADKDRFIEANSFAGSVNPGFNFSSRYDLSGQMAELKDRLGWGDEINDGVNWAYAANTFDPTTAAIVLIILLLIMASGYLIIYNIFYIAVSSDIRYYGLLKTVGTTNRQLRRIIVRQAAMISSIAIPVGLILGYFVSVVLVPYIMSNFNAGDSQAIADIRIFAASAVFSWLTVRAGCIKPCRIIKKISPVEAVRYSEYAGDKLSAKRKTHKVTVTSMAWENLKRSRRKTILVVLSLALSVIVINVTVSVISSFDKNLYVKNFAATDFMVADGSVISKNYQDMDYEGVADTDIESLSRIDGVTDIGAIRMSETLQLMEGKALDRMAKTYKEHPDWFAFSEDHKAAVEHEIYETHSIDAHIYGMDEFPYENMEIDAGEIDWEKFRTGKYVIVSSPVESGNGKKDAEYAFYQIGENAIVVFPDGTEDEYEVMAIGDIPYAMGPEHSHGLDVYFTLPMGEYLRHIPESGGAMKLFFNADEAKLEAVDDEVREYCEVTKPQLGYTSRMTYLDDFKEMVRMFLLVGGALSFVLALIGVMNFINLTVTSINERRTELGTLRAIGMTGRQMTQMLRMEGVFRICLTFAFVLTAGMLLNHILVNLIAGQMMMFSYKFVIWPVLACIPIFTAISIVVPGMAVREPIDLSYSN